MARVQIQDLPVERTLDQEQAAGVIGGTHCGPAVHYNQCYPVQYPQYPVQFGQCVPYTPISPYGPCAPVGQYQYPVQYPVQQYPVQWSQPHCPPPCPPPSHCGPQ